MIALPPTIARPLRRMFKHPKKKRQARYLLLLPILIIYNHTTDKLSLSNPNPTTTEGTTLITPCNPHKCLNKLTTPQILNLHAIQAKTTFLHISTICNTTTYDLPLSDNRFYTTSTSIILPRAAFLKTGFDERLEIPLLTTLIKSLSIQHIQLSPQTASTLIFTHLPLTPWSAQQSTVYKSAKGALKIYSSPPLQRLPDLRQPRKRVLHDVHHLPWPILNRVNDTALQPLIERLDHGGKVVVVHVAHGLGNRLRALGSALAFAEATNRVPLVVWSKDAHCTVAFEDLFSDPPFVVMDDLPGYPFKDAKFYDYTWQYWDLYNYMPGEGGTKDAFIDNSDNHIYYKGAYVMRTPQTSWDAANRHLRALTPVDSVRSKVDQVSERLSRSIGVHIRHLSTKDDIGGVDPVGEYGDFDTRVIGYFRAICSPRVFIEELSKVRRETGLTDVFVASDSPRWRTEIGREIDGVWGMGDCYGRCEIEALVDLLALSRCSTVLGSFWSSFSEAVQRFSGRKIRLAGVDFGSGVSGFGWDVEGYVRDIVAKRRAAGK